MKKTSFSISLAVSLPILFSALSASAPVHTGPLPQVRHEPAPLPEKEMAVVVLGDIMPGRYVETIASRNGGYGALFSSSTPFFEGADIVFGNLEGPIPAVHKKTPINGFSFSFSSSSIFALRKLGLSVASLANNHSMNAGFFGYEQTRSALHAQGIDAVGHPSLYGEEYVFRTGHLIFIGLNDTGPSLKIASTTEFISKIKREKKQLLFVSVHFGEEYRATSTARQKEVAHALVDAGADAVFGAHPHVVQEFEAYKGKPIYYSLGNFLFDQYFSRETQIGLSIRALIFEDRIEYSAVPVDLHQSRPRPMNGEEAESFLSERGVEAFFTAMREK